MTMYNERWAAADRRCLLAFSATLQDFAVELEQTYLDGLLAQGQRRAESHAGDLLNCTDASWRTRRPYRRTRGDKSTPVTRQSQSTDLG
jgi:hypothetical protein